MWRPECGTSQIIIQIAELRIKSPNKLNLPGSSPVLDLLLPFNSLTDSRELVEPYELGQIITGRKQRSGSGFMAVHSLLQPGRNTRVEGGVMFVSHDIYESRFHGGMRLEG